MVYCGALCSGPHKTVTAAIDSDRKMLIEGSTMLSQHARGYGPCGFPGYCANEIIRAFLLLAHLISTNERAK